MNPSHKNWQEETIGTVCVIEKGKKPKNSGPRTPLRTIPYINIKAFESGIPEAFAEPGNYPKCKTDDVLIVWDGARSGLVGRGVSGYIGSTLARIASDRLANPFLFYFLNSKYSAINSRTKGVGIPHINPQVLNEFLVPIPPDDEQVRIVSEIEKQFTRLDAGVEALRRVQAKLKKYRASVLKAACEGRLVPTEAELAKKEGRPYETGSQLLARILADRRKNWQGRGQYKDPSSLNTATLPTLPEGWTWATVEQLTSLVTSGSRGWGKLYSDSGPLFIRAQDIKTDSLKLAGVARVALPEKAEGMRSSVENYDMLITITGANVTKSAIVRGLSEVAFVSQHVALLKPIRQDASPFYFLWIVSPANGRRVLERWAYGAGKPGLSLEQIRGLLIALPPLTEQMRIVAEVERRLSVVDELETAITANLQRAARLRQSVLNRAFNGEACG
jgi:type I restriction enzyme S subunit